VRHIRQQQLDSHIWYGDCSTCVASIRRLTRQRVSCNVMNSDPFQSAYRIALGGLLLWVLWGLAGNVFGFSTLIIQMHDSNAAAVAAASQKMSAASLEAELTRMKLVPAASGIHCTSALPEWDYVCSYMPTPTQSKTRLHLGLNVNATQWLEASGSVPEDADVPPSKRHGR
jgi:hypothetical protein